MSFEGLLQFVPAFVLVFFRLAGLALFAPLFGSSRIPRRVKLLLVLILALGMTQSATPAFVMPESVWGLAVGIAGEIVFGFAMGMILSFVFIAMQWAGEMMGQQMGLNLSEVFDPQFGQHGSLVGDMYFMLALIVFLLIRGHHAMLIGVHQSFEALPLLAVGMDRPLLDLMLGLFQSATVLAIQVAAPMFVTMLVIDVALGFIGKTMPQLNVMTAGVTIRSLVGSIVLIVGLMLTSNVMRGALLDSMDVVRGAFAGMVQ